MPAFPATAYKHDPKLSLHKERLKLVLVWIINTCIFQETCPYPGRERGRQVLCDSRRVLFFSVSVGVTFVLWGMNDFVWGLKNGDLDQVIEAVEKVRQTPWVRLLLMFSSFLSLHRKCSALQRHFQDFIIVSPLKTAQHLPGYVFLPCIRGFEDVGCVAGVYSFSTLCCFTNYRLSSACHAIPPSPFPGVFLRWILAYTPTSGPAL